MTTTAQPGTPSMTVRITRIVRTTEQIDLAAALNRLSPAVQAEYWEMDLEGFDEWDRPVLWAPRALVDGVVGDIEDEDWRRVTTRGGSEVWWSEEDYDRLVTLVPWLAPPPEPSPEDLARIPGPADTPLPLDGAR